MPKPSSQSRNVSKTVKMSESHAERLERVCNRLDVSVNSYMLQALSRALIADEGRIAQADMAHNMIDEVSKMFAPMLASVQQELDGIEHKGEDSDPKGEDSDPQ